MKKQFHGRYIVWHETYKIQALKSKLLQEINFERFSLFFKVSVEFLYFCPSHKYLENLSKNIISLLFFEEILFLLISVVLINLASKLKFGLKRSIYLLFAWLNSTMLSIFIIIEFFENGLAAEEIIMSVYSFSVFGGLIIHFFANLKRKKVYANVSYRLETNLNLKKSHF